MDISGLKSSAGMVWNKIKKSTRNFVLVYEFILLGLIFVHCAQHPVVTEYGVFAPSRLSFVKGQDGCTPIDFDENTTLWTFGDTITQEGMISNSLAFTRKPTVGTVSALHFEYYTENGKVAPFIKNDKSENPAKDRLWAFDGVRIGNIVYVYYVRVFIQDSQEPLSFTHKESSIAYWNIPPGWHVGNKVNFIRRKNMFTGDVPAFGASVFPENEYLYVVGHMSSNKKSSLIIARVHKDFILQRKHYQFLQSDSSWNNNLAGALRVYDDVAGECSLTWDEEYHAYCLVYCQLFTGNIIMCMAPSIEKLAHAKKNIVYSPPQLKNTTMMYYSAKAIAHENKQYYIVYMNPLRYQPYLIKLELQ